MQGKCSKAKARVKGDNWMKAYSFWFLASEMLSDKCALAYNEQTKEAISGETLLQSSERLGSRAAVLTQGSEDELECCTG